MKMRKLPKVDLEELKKIQEENFRERLAFIKKYAEWLKKAPNKVWSTQQKDMMRLMADQWFIMAWSARQNSHLNEQV